MSANVLVGAADAGAVLELVRRHDVDVLSLQELTPGFVERLDAGGADERLPVRVLAARAGTVGLGVMVRPGLSATAAAVERTRLEAAIALPGGRRLRVTAVHPVPPLRPASVRAWRSGLEALPATGGGPVPRVLAGDFNATLDHRVLRRVLARGYRDAAAVRGAGLRPTWSSGGSVPPITIDHVLADERLGIRRFTVHPVPGSDHRAVIAELVLP